MSRDRKIVIGIVVGVLLLLVIGNIGYATLNNRSDVSGWRNSIGADEVVEYTQTPARPLHLHLFRADTAEPSPVLVLFHGGGLADIRLDQFLPQAERLTAAGYAVAIAEYRVRGDGASSQESADDAAHAVAWLQENGDSVGIDEDAVVAGGASAGGWLAARAAHTANPPIALVLFNPAVDESDSPPDPVPTIIFHAVTDRIVPVERVQAFCDASDDCEMDIWPEGDHGFFNADVIPEAFEHSTNQTIRFLDQISS